MHHVKRDIRLYIYLSAQLQVYLMVVQGLILLRYHGFYLSRSDKDQLLIRFDKSNKEPYLSLNLTKLQQSSLVLLGAHGANNRLISVQSLVQCPEVFQKTQLSFLMASVFSLKKLYQIVNDRRDRRDRHPFPSSF